MSSRGPFQSQLFCNSVTSIAATAVYIKVVRGFCCMWDRLYEIKQMLNEHSGRSYVFLCVFPPPPHPPSYECVGLFCFLFCFLFKLLFGKRQKFSCFLQCPTYVELFGGKGRWSYLGRLIQCKDLSISFQHCLGRKQ